jgi:transcriptional regulator with XRE-family HTH domain
VFVSLIPRYQMTVGCIDDALRAIVRAERQERKLSQSRLAEQLYLSPPAMSYIEAGRIWRIGAQLAQWNRLLRLFGLELHVEVRALEREIIPPEH